MATSATWRSRGSIAKFSMLAAAAAKSVRPWPGPVSSSARRRRAVTYAPLVGATFTLVLSPILIAVLVLSVLVTTVVVFDAESNWLEGVALIVLYCLCATAFFWG
jgi:Ca2+/Na+ antiporter